MSEEGVRLRYLPISVRDLLTEMRNVSGLMIDLAYYAALFYDRDLAREVLMLENYIDQLEEQLEVHASLAARSMEVAKQMVIVFKIATAMNKISDAAGDIAKIPLLFKKEELSILCSVPEVEELVAKVQVSKELSGLMVKDIPEVAKAVIDVVAVRRGNIWVINPSQDFKLAEGDTVIVRGAPDAVEAFLKVAGVKRYLESCTVSGEVSKLLSEFSHIKTLSEIMVDLAFYSAVSRDVDIANEIKSLEAYMDKKHIELEEKIISLSRDLGVKAALALVRMCECLEDIADAASEIADAALLGELPESVMFAIGESDEVVARIKIDGELSGKTLKQLALEDYGISPILVKRGSDIVILPKEDFAVKEGDVILVKVYRDAISEIPDFIRRRMEMPL